jgi:hypothetical protein
LWTLSLIGDLSDFFSASGVAPRQPVVEDQWGVFGYWTDDQALMIGWCLLLASAIALTVGWHTRIAGVLVFLLLCSFQYRNPYIFNSGDALMRIEALFLALAPSGAALSLDQRRINGRFWSAQDEAPWGIRLLQIQLTVIYVATFMIRQRGGKWPDGTALSYALRLKDMLIFPAPQWVTASAPLMNIATWTTLFLELAIGILVWNRRCRPYVLIAGVLLHGTILLTIAVGFFTPAMFVLYLAFVDAETIRRLPETSKHLAQRGLRRMRSILPKLPKDEGRRPDQPPPSHEPQSHSQQRPRGKSERRRSSATPAQRTDTASYPAAIPDQPRLFGVTAGDFGHGPAAATAGTAGHRGHARLALRGQLGHRQRGRVSDGGWSGDS